MDFKLILISAVVTLSLTSAKVPQLKLEQKMSSQSSSRLLIDSKELHQKELLLELLESKLRSIDLSRKKKIESTTPDTSPKDPFSVHLDVDGISAVGQSVLKLRLGGRGKKNEIFVKQNAKGIAAIGTSQLILELGDGSLNFSGLHNIIGENNHRRTNNSDFREPDDSTFKSVLSKEDNKMLYKDKDKEIKHNSAEILHLGKSDDGDELTALNASRRDLTNETLEVKYKGSKDEETGEDEKQNEKINQIEEDNNGQDDHDESQAHKLDGELMSPSLPESHREFIKIDQSKNMADNRYYTENEQAADNSALSSRRFGVNQGNVENKNHRIEDPHSGQFRRKRIYTIRTDQFNPNNYPPNNQDYRDYSRDDPRTQSAQFDNKASNFNKNNQNTQIGPGRRINSYRAAAAAAAAAEALADGGGVRRREPPPLLRSRTLPAIVVPGLSILHAQIDPNYNDLCQSQLLTRGLNSSYKVGGLRAHTPRISFTCKDGDSPDLQDLRRKSASSRLGSSPRPSIASTGSSDDRDSNVVLRVPPPHGSGLGGRASVCGASGAGAVVGGLARLIAQGGRAPLGAEQETDNGGRRLSWERREQSSGHLPRSSSIDSMVEAVWAGPRRSEPAPISLPVPRPDRALSLVSPAVGRRAKAQRGIAELQYGALLEGCAGELPSLSACAPLPLQDANKMTKKQTKEQQAQLDKLAQINIHSQALFAAVEHGHLDKARNILESTDVDVNSLNSDGLSPLDVAVLVNHRQLARVLMEFGAKEGTHLKTPEAMGAHLRRLSREAEARLHEVTGCANVGSRTPDDFTRSAATASAAGGGATTTGCAGGAAAERDKQAQHWERRVRALKRLVLGWQQTKTPGAPPSPELEVCGAHAVYVRVRDVKQDALNHSPIVTKYKVQWSSRADFSNVCGAQETGAGGGARVQAAGLTRGRRYFFRAQAGNIRGWGPFSVSTPRSVVPSTWRDVDSRATRWDVASAAEALESLSTAATGARLTRAPALAPRAPRKKTATIRQLFTAASKFQKNLRRGVYLACILYHEDKVLVTNEDFLPVIEVDETYPTCIYSDFHWLMKVSCAWDDVKSLRSDMEKHTSSSIQFRLKILTAVVQMQSALCIQDLGQVYHKPLRDSHGTLVLSCVSSVKSAKAASVLNSRWLPLSRLRRRLKALDEDNTISDLLMASIHDQISYHQVSAVQLSRGLYLGYMKLQSSVEVVRIVVPAKTPNVPPHTKVRDNPHVSAEEWEYLKNYQTFTTNNEDAVSTRRMSITSIKQDKTASESQQMFLDQITAAAKRLCKDMEIPAENADAHRLYDLEIIELNNEVSLIMICPPAELACSVPGQKEILLQRGDLLSLPIQAFEMIHLQTYHNTILNKYSRLSCVLELDVALATHSHREAFSCSELQQAKERLSKLEDLQNNLNAIWKAARWLMDLISFARDKDKACANTGIPLKNILHRKENKLAHDRTDSNKTDTDSNRVDLRVDFLQIPPRETKITKTSPGRGSWPGPAGSPNANLHPELSKSEQHLSMAPRPSSASTLNLSGSQYLSATSDNFSRKGSADSQFTHSSIASNNYLGSNYQFDVKSTGSYLISNVRLPPSRSEDTLVINQNENPETRKKPHFLNASMSATSSPLLTVKGYYPGSMVSVKTNNTTTTSDSMHSLSSDSESQSCPLNSSTPNKNQTKFKNYQKSSSHIIPSKSMTDVKKDVDFVDTGQSDLFLKPTAYVRNTSTPSGSVSSNKTSKTDENVQPINENDRDICTKTSSETVKISDQPGILQVYAAYETGLASGTSLKLHVTPRTSAREVIDLVVRQLNMAAVLKGKSGPVYGPERLHEFCLVAVIGARERCLRDDFRPLQLQNPWRKGRLYVRLRHDVLAALQHSAKQPAYI